MLRDEVTAEDVAGVVSAWTGIPLTKLKTSEKEKLLKLDEKLHERIVAQDKAVRDRQELLLTEGGSLNECLSNPRHLRRRRTLVVGEESCL